MKDRSHLMVTFRSLTWVMFVASVMFLLSLIGVSTPVNMLQHVVAFSCSVMLTVVFCCVWLCLATQPKWDSEDKVLPRTKEVIDISQY